MVLLKDFFWYNSQIHLPTFLYKNIVDMRLLLQIKSKIKHENKLLIIIYTRKNISNSTVTKLVSCYSSQASPNHFIDVCFWFITTSLKFDYCSVLLHCMHVYV